jgi:pimeloyl-ACP methyl ester carboxylesterase
MSSTDGQNLLQGTWERRLLPIPKLGDFDVRVWNAGTGRPLMFLHGYERHPGDASFLQHLARSRTVMAPEQPGYGESLGEEMIRDIFDLVLFYRSLLVESGFAKTDIIGHSSGGMIAAEIAAMCPQSVRRLVLVNAFGLWQDETGGVDPFGRREEVVAAKWHDPAGAPDPEPSNFDLVSSTREDRVLFETRNLANAAKLLWPLPDRGLRRRLPYIECPTLVINGGSDGLVPPSYGEEFAQLIPDARLVILEGAGHYPMFEQEDTFNQELEAFLEGD